MKKDHSRNKISDEIKIWKEQEAIHIKTINLHDDPVELTASEARQLAEELCKLARVLDS